MSSLFVSLSLSPMHGYIVSTRDPDSTIPRLTTLQITALSKIRSHHLTPISTKYRIISPVKMRPFHIQNLRSILTLSSYYEIPLMPRFLRLETEVSNSLWNPFPAATTISVGGLQGSSPVRTTSDTASLRDSSTCSRSSCSFRRL